MQFRRLGFLVLPFALVAIGARWAVPRWGDWIARQLKDVAVLVPSATPARHEDHAPAEPIAPVAADPLDGAEGDAGARDDAGKRLAVGRPSKDAGAVVAAPSSLRIPAAAVQRAIDDAGKTIRGRTVRGPDGKPAGVRLTGVSNAGLGLRDGDVIVAVDGRPTMDDDVATDAAIAAVGRGDSVLRATVMRGDRVMAVTLELPLTPLDAGKAR